MKREIILHKREGKITIEPSENAYILVTPDGRTYGLEMADLPKTPDCSTCDLKDVCPIATGIFDGKTKPPQGTPLAVKVEDLPEFLKKFFHM